MRWVHIEYPSGSHSGQTQISRNLIRPEHPLQSPNRFEILRKTRQYRVTVVLCAKCQHLAHEKWILGKRGFKRFEVKMCFRWISYIIHMMTSSNRNIFRVTGPLCGEFTGPRWIPLTKASDAELWCFLIYAWINSWVNNREAGDLRRNGAHYDVIVMTAGKIVYSSGIHQSCEISVIFDIHFGFLIVWEWAEQDNRNVVFWVKFQNDLANEEIIIDLRDYARYELKMGFDSSPLVPHTCLTWTNADLFSIGNLRTNCIDIRIKIRNFSFKKMHLQCLWNGGHFVHGKMRSALF